MPDLLPEGTTVQAGPPKLGKSCLVYQVADEVALGVPSHTDERSSRR